MATHPITAADLERFCGHLAGRDRTAAVRQAFGLLEAGVTVQDLVLDLLGPAQAEVGRRWETNQWSVADEHAATAISDAVLAALAWQAKGTIRGGTARDAASHDDDDWQAVPRGAARLVPGRSQARPVTDLYYPGPQDPAPGHDGRNPAREQ